MIISISYIYRCLQDTHTLTYKKIQEIAEKSKREKKNYVIKLITQKKL